MTTPAREPGRRPPGLGPHCVGRRVVVRRLVRGVTGPTGGPAFTDVLGVMESWDAEARATVVRREDGAAVAIALDDIVSGKPVPPRPSVRHRASPGEVQLRAAATWPAVEVDHLGGWLLRAASGFSRRANSALAVGDPGRPLPEAQQAVRDFYAARDLPARCMVVVGSEEEAALTGLGWEAEPGEVTVLVGGVARAVRAARRTPGSDRRPVELHSAPGERWLASDPRTAAAPAVARAVLAGAAQVAFASVLDGPAGSPTTSLVARGRVALDDRPDPWATLTSMWVAPELRRHGLGRAVVHALLDWSAERGATTVQLQVTDDNAPALALYQGLGLTPHHRYRYLRR